MGEYGLEQQFLDMVKILEQMQTRISSVEQANQTLLRSNRQLLELLQDKEQELLDYQRNLIYELNDPRLTKQKNWYPTLAPIEETIEKIITEGKSLARFGDGEFSTIAGRVRHKFQTEPDAGLGERLKEVLCAQENQLLIGIADNYGMLDCYNEQAKREIRRYMNPEIRREHLQLLRRDRVYENAYLTRPYVMYADNQTDAPAKRFEKLKQIWNNRKCVFVEGCQSALGVGNDLFDNAGSIKRILGPAENAYRHYPDIYRECLKQDKDSLFLLALGPSATILAYDLCKMGYQAVDIGHIDLEYEWFLKGEGRRIAIAEKYNNEVPDGNHPQEIKDEKYRAEIIADFS